MGLKWICVAELRFCSSDRRVGGRDGAVNLLSHSRSVSRTYHGTHTQTESHSLPHTHAITQNPIISQSHVYFS